jgi:cytochrome oxidase Cu insertion factor (SCO1/SenC/PrrC family)
MISVKHCFVILSLVLVLTLSVSCLSEESTETSEQEVGAVGSKVVDFNLTTYQGEAFTNANLQGKVTLLIFWFPT